MKKDECLFNKKDVCESDWSWSNSRRFFIIDFINRFFEWMYIEWAIDLLAIQWLYVLIDSMNSLMLFLSFEIESSDKQISLDLIHLYELIKWVMRSVSCD